MALDTSTVAKVIQVNNSIGSAKFDLVRRQDSYSVYASIDFPEDGWIGNGFDHKVTLQRKNASGGWDNIAWATKRPTQYYKHELSYQTSLKSIHFTFSNIVVKGATMRLRVELWNGSTYLNATAYSNTFIR